MEIKNSEGPATIFVRSFNFTQELAGQAFNMSNIPYQFTVADDLWHSFVNKIKTYTDNHGGSAQANTAITKRPDWYEVRDVLNGKKPASLINCK